MKFTGERFVKECGISSITVEHEHRYKFVQNFVEDKIVLDLSSDLGYGIEMISEKASFIYSVHTDNEVIEYCKEKYEYIDNVEFICGAATDIPLEDNCVDYVVSYETIEYINSDEQQKFIKEIKRVLKLSGVLVMSISKKLEYKDITDYDIEEYRKFLNANFSNVILFNQDYKIVSTIYNGEAYIYEDMIHSNNDGMYIIGVCSDSEIDIDCNNSLITGIPLDNQMVNIDAPVGKLYFDNGTGFDEQKIIKEPFKLSEDNLSICFDISDLKNVTEYRFVPIEEEFIEIKIIEMYFQSSEDEKYYVDDYTTNGTENDSGYLVFDIADPNIVFSNIDKQDNDRLVITLSIKLKSFIPYITELYSARSNKMETKNLKEIISKTLNVKHYPKDTDFVPIKYEIDGVLSIEVVFVTYNSQEWLEGLFNSLEKTNIENIELSLTFVDNNSSDDTEKILQEYKKKFSSKIPIKIIKNEKKSGFGYACNTGAFASKKEYIFFLNIATEVFVDTFQILRKEIINVYEDVGLIELRQMPYEHPKYYDPLTGETSWVSGACCIIKSEIFKSVNGFDEKMFMYVEDVDLSFRVRNLGYKNKYLFNCPVINYSNRKENEFKPEQYFNSIFSNLMLRYRYGSRKDIREGITAIKKLKETNNHLSENHNERIDEFLNIAAKEGRKFRGGVLPKYKNVDVNFYGFDYEQNKYGAFFINEINEIENGPFVSVIVRTCKRPDTLRETLISLRNQTYKNFEVVIVEDGENTAENMIKTEFGDLDIIYSYTDRNVGRSKVGNIAMSLSNGEYLNFLDDDDLFYPDHLELLSNEIAKDRFLDFVYSTAMATAIEVISKTPYTYKIYDKEVQNKGCFQKSILLNNNVFPIQTIMFKKEFFDTYGGFDTKYDYLEDWDLWLKFFRNDVKFAYIEKTTSVYRVPFDKNIVKDRNYKLNSNYYTVKEKYINEIFNRHIDINYTSMGINSCVDDIYIENRDGRKWLVIFGWAFLSDDNIDHSKCKTNIVLNLKNRTVMFPAIMYKRQDVANIYENEDIMYCGINFMQNFTDKQLGEIEIIDIVLSCEGKHVLIHSICNELVNCLIDASENLNDGEVSRSYKELQKDLKIKKIRNIFENIEFNIKETDIEYVNKDTTFSIDNISIEKKTSETEISFYGWAFVNDAKEQEASYKSKILFTLEGNRKVILQANEVIRTDVSEAYDNKCDNNSGFKFEIPLDNKLFITIESIELILVNKNRVVKVEHLYLKEYGTNIIKNLITNKYEFELFNGNIKSDKSCSNIDYLEITESSNIYTIMLGGWAFLKEKNNNYNDISMLVKTKTKNILIKSPPIERRDLVKTFNKEDAINSGFDFKIAVNDEVMKDIKAIKIVLYNDSDYILVQKMSIAQLKNNIVKS